MTHAESKLQRHPGPVRSVCLISHAWPAGSVPNGVVTYTGQLAQSLVDLGVDTSLLVSEAHAPVPEQQGPGAGRLRVVQLSDYWDRESALSRNLRKAVNRIAPASVTQRSRALLMRKAVDGLQHGGKIDILEVEDTDGMADTVYELRPDFPVVMRLHGPWFLNGPALGVAEDDAFHERVKREGVALQRADAITAPSQDVLDQTREHYGLSLPDAVVIPNPVEDVPPAYRWSFQDRDPNRILFVGRFDKHKGGDIALLAFAKLAQDRPEVVLDFVGPDKGIVKPSGDREGIGAFLDRELTDPAVRRRINVHGRLPGEEVQRMRKQAAAVIAPSRYENFGYAVLECQVAGVPLVVSEVGGMCEIVTHEQTGLVCASEDAAALAAQVARLLDNPELAKKLSENGRASALARYAPEVIAKQTLAFYEAVVGRGGDDSRKRGAAEC